jgi:catechol 2,3-dioxygenase-like lactoylglutathione lyase family enzyme
MSEAATVTGIVESAVYVEDLDRSLRFYQDLFGFEVEIHDDLICVLRVPGRQALILFPKRIAAEPGRTSSPAGTVEGVIPPHGGSGRLHFAFGILAAELPAWERRLAERGIAIDGRVAWRRGGTSIYFRDPDDHLVELITPGLWSFY